MILVGNFWSIAYHFFMSRYNVGFLPFFRETLIFKTVSKKNWQGFKGFAIKEPHNFIIRIDISSCPWALFGSNDLIFLTMPSVQNSKVDSFCSVANVILGGIELLLFTVVHGRLKKSLNKFAFTKKVYYKLISI